MAKQKLTKLKKVARQYTRHPAGAAGGAGGRFAAQKEAQKGSSKNAGKKSAQKADSKGSAADIEFAAKLARNNEIDWDDRAGGTEASKTASRQRQALNAAFSDCNDPDAQAAVDVFMAKRGAKILEPPILGSNGSPNYDSQTRRIQLIDCLADGDETYDYAPDRAGQVGNARGLICHEVGHSLDNELGPLTGRMGDRAAMHSKNLDMSQDEVTIRETYDIEMGRYYDRMTARMATVAEEYESARIIGGEAEDIAGSRWASLKAQRDRTTIAVADIAGCFTRNELGFGHSTEYLDIPGKKEAEVFANTFAVLTSGDDLAIEALSRMTPNAVTFVRQACRDAKEYESYLY